MATGSNHFDDMFMSCDEHSGMKLDILCRDHEAVLCSICASQEHMACIGLEPITNEFAKSMKKKDFKQLGKDLSEMKHALTRLKNKRQEEKKKLHEETEKAVKEVEDFRKLIDWVLDRMEQKGKEYIQKRYKEMSKKINEDILRCEEMLSFLAKTKDQWKSGKDKTTVEQFVNLKQGTQAMKKAQKLCDKLKCQTSRDMVKFTVDPKVENFARNLSWYGKDKTYLSFEQPLSFPHLYEVKQDCQVDVRVRGDKHVCCFVDMCQLEDGTILAADIANRRIKQLDILYKIVDTLDISGEPRAVASVNNEKAVVAVASGSLSHIQFVEIGNDLALGDSFTVPGQCRGIACSPELIYVSIDSKICSFGIDGEMIAEFDFGKPASRIQLTADFSNLIILDSSNKLSIRDKHFEMFKEVVVENISPESDIAVDSNGQIFICIFDSHCIEQYGHDLEKLGVVVGPTRGVKNPQTITFDRINNRLVVGMKFKNVIKAFELK